MRISDWSSDVCSSDLPANEIGWYLGGIGKGFVEDARQVLDDIQAVGGLQVDLVVVGLQMTSDALGVGGLVVPRLLEADREGLHRPVADRKSVVEGKSVSVRVVLGGCRTIKTTK